MNAYRNLTMIAIAAAFALFAPAAWAQMPSEKVTVTVSNPIEVPGLVLPAGSYVFESLKGENLTRILSADRSHIYATLPTVPDERREAMDSAIVTLKEAPEGAPERVDSWFISGESTGHEFLYPASSPEGNLIKKVGRGTEESLKYAAEPPEYVAVHVEHAVVHFFTTKFLVA